MRRLVLVYKKRRPHGHRLGVDDVAENGLHRCERDRILLGAIAESRRFVARLSAQEADQGAAGVGGEKLYVRERGALGHVVERCALVLEIWLFRGSVSSSTLLLVFIVAL